MTREIAVVTIAVCAGVAAFAQAAAKQPEFEVASVKAAALQEGPRRFGGIRGGPGTDDPGRITCTNMPLKSLLMNAWDLKSYQLVGPGWMESEYRYDIVAKVPDGATKEQAKLMLRRLLTERFKLETHNEQKEMPVYDLVVAKNGLKLKESPPDPSAPPGGSGGVSFRMSPVMMTMNAKSMGISGLLGTLGQLGRPVFDKTGLTGVYDFTLEYAPNAGTVMALGGAPPPEATDSQAPSIAVAIQQQLGLKLEPSRAIVELLVIDKAEKTPVEN